MKRILYTMVCLPLLVFLLVACDKKDEPIEKREIIKSQNQQNYCDDTCKSDKTDRIDNIEEKEVLIYEIIEQNLINNRLYPCGFNMVNKIYK